MRNHSAYLLAVAAVKNSSIAAVALTIGYSRPALSRYLSDSYGADGKDIEAAINMHFDSRICPHLTKKVTLDFCQQKALAARPVKAGSAREQHWLACQACPIKPMEKRS